MQWIYTVVKAFYDATDTVLQLFRVIQGLASQRGQKKRHIAASREARIIPTRPDTRHKVLRNTFFRQEREGVTDLWMDGRTDGRTDRRTDPHIEVLRST